MESKHQYHFTYFSQVIEAVESLIKTVSHSVSKLFLYQGINVDEPRLLALAPTGVAAININGTAIILV